MSRRRPLVRYVEADSDDDQPSSPEPLRYRTRSSRRTPSPDVDRENRMIPARYSLRKRKHVYVSTDFPIRRPRTSRYPLRHSLPARVMSPSPPIQMETEDSDTGIVIRLTKAGSEGPWILGKQAHHQVQMEEEEADQHDGEQNEDQEDAQQNEDEEASPEEQERDLEEPENQVEEQEEVVEELEHQTEDHNRERVEEEEEAFEPADDGSSSAESECSEDEGGASVEEDLIELSSGLESGRRYSLRRRNGAIQKTVSSRYPVRERRRSSSLHSFQLPDSIPQKNSRPARRRNINRVQGDQLLPINWGETPDPEAGDSDCNVPFFLLLFFIWIWELCSGFE